MTHSTEPWGVSDLAFFIETSQLATSVGAGRLVEGTAATAAEKVMVATAKVSVGREWAE
jgi:hypothetical protein